MFIPGMADIYEGEYRASIQAASRDFRAGGDSGDGVLIAS